MAELISKCEVCRAYLDEEDLFCANCGKEAPVRSEDSDDAHRPGTTRLFTHNFDCRGCGASMSYDASAGTLRCPFCGSEKLEQQSDQKSLAPNYVLPFEVSQKKANHILREWMGSSFWRPSDLAETAKVTKMTAVFVPYWVFEATTHTYWNADTSQTPFGARGDWFPLHGSNRSTYAGVLVGASSTLSPSETFALCPFNLGTRVDPDDIDLENVVVEQFRVQRKYARPLARGNLEQLERESCSSQVPGRCRNLKVNVMLEGLRGEPALIPVWVMAYQYRGQLFRFLLNGQSGKATGTAPFSWKKLGLVVGAVLGILLLILFGASLAGAFGMLFW